MIVKRDRKHTSKPEWIVRLGRWMLIFFITGSLLTLAAFAVIWADNINHYSLKSVKLSGNKYLTKDEIFKWIQLPTYPSISDLDLETLQYNLETHPFIKAARLSRNFPSTLKIEIYERTPLAYIDHEPYLLVDEEGVVLPLIDEIFDFDIPTMAGFNPADELYPLGEKCLSLKVLEAVGIISAIQKEYSTLYDNLSELSVDTDNTYILNLSRKPTKIYLGSSNIPIQVKLLSFFENTIRDIHSIYDYQYVNLRYDKQIIVKERKKV